MKWFNKEQMYGYLTVLSSYKPPLFLDITEPENESHLVAEALTLESSCVTDSSHDHLGFCIFG